MEPSPSRHARRPLRPGAGVLLLGVIVPLVALLLVALLLRPDTRTAWEQAALTRGLPEEHDPVRQNAWTGRLRALLRQADALGPRPVDPAARRAWLVAQCRINRNLQALQRERNRPVEDAATMGRPAACEELALLRP